jgi:adenosylhomocysteine nucleosidase
VLAIVSAMPEELSLVIESLSAVTTREHGRRQFHLGTFHGAEVVAVFSHWGKVAAAATVAQLFASYPVTALVFSGMAGGVRHGVAIGDVVVGTELIQHDMDASPIFPRYEVPLLGRALFNADPDLTHRLVRAASLFLEQDLFACVASQELDFFEIAAPAVIQGCIASGDKFFASAAAVEELRQRLPSVVCVEMEGAAVAQVCAEYSVPFGIVRTISDSADDNSAHDFPRFSREIARHYSRGILERFLRGAW